MKTNLIESLKAAYQNAGALTLDANAKIRTLCEKLDNSTLEHIVDARIKYVSAAANITLHNRISKTEARHLAMIRSADRIDAARAARINAR